MDGHGWMDGLMQDQPNVRPDSGTTRLTHDHTHAQPETHDQTYAQPDSRKTRLTQDMYAIIIPTNSIYPRALPY